MDREQRDKLREEAWDIFRISHEKALATCYAKVDPSRSAMLEASRVWRDAFNRADVEFWTEIKPALDILNAALAQTDKEYNNG